MRGLILLTLSLVGILAAPTASADRWCAISCYSVPWDGQQQQTWNTPGYYGGWTTNPVACDPFTTTCSGFAVPGYGDYSGLDDGE